jgi:hypothetical protein
MSPALEGLFWFMAKSFALVLLMMWLRWTLPRYRVDQLMDLCWKKLTPLAFLTLFAIGAGEYNRYLALGLGSVVGLLALALVGKAMSAPPPEGLPPVRAPKENAAPART